MKFITTAGSACLALAIVSAATAPALALDDGQEPIWTAVGGFVGLINKPRVDIDYRERAPLVLPPKMQLPQPKQPLAERTAAWPVDPDVEAARKAKDTSRLLSLWPVDPKESSRPLSKQELLSGRAAAQRPPLPPQDVDRCASDGKGCTKWNPNEGASLAEKQGLVPGQEPERTSLTDPPKGYRLATKAVKATNEGPRQGDDQSARAFYKKAIPKPDE